MHAFVAGDVGVGVFPVACVLPIQHSLVVDESLMRGDVFGVALFVLFEQVVALFDDQFLGQRGVVACFLGHLVTVFVEIEGLLVVW